MNLECLNVLHEITVESHPVPPIPSYMASYLNFLIRKQIVKISGTISLQVKIPTSLLSVNIWDFSTELITIQLSSWWHSCPISVDFSLKKLRVCTYNIYRFIDCLCMGSHNSGMLPYVHVGHPKLRQLWALDERTVIISRHDSESSLKSPTQPPK